MLGTQQIAALALCALCACGPIAQSPPACVSALSPGDLVITEVFADSADGADTGKEWFEIYNNTSGPLELHGLELQSSRPDGSSLKSHYMRELVIAPDQYLVLGDTEQADVQPYVDYGYGGDLGTLYNSGGGELTLRCGDTVIDAAGYDDIVAGHSREFTNASPPDPTLNDDPAHWCEGDETEFTPSNFGTPGQDNDCQPMVVGACLDVATSQMRAAVAPAIGDLVITEIMPRPTVVSDEVGQWFEITAANSVDLNGVGLDRANDALAPEPLDSPDCIHMDAGDYAVFARSIDSTSNGGIDALAAFTFSIDPTTSPDLQLVYGDQVIDRITWSTSQLAAGASLQLDPDSTDAAANDDPANFCLGTIRYDSSGSGASELRDLGTPGTANTTCASTPGAGQCSDSGIVRDIVPPAAGQLVISELLPNAAGTGTDPAQEWFELANTGSAAFDLNELGFQGNAEAVDVLHDTDCKSIPAGGYALFAHSTDPTVNGGLPPVTATFTFALSTKLSVFAGATLLDNVTLASPLPADGTSRQVNPADLTATGNDAAADFCDAVPAQTYGSAANYGTPGAPNVCM